MWKSRCLAIGLLFAVAATAVAQDVDALTRQLASPDPADRARAAAELGALGEKAADAVPQLAEALTDWRPEVRLSAARALGHVGVPSHAAITSLGHLARCDRPEEATAACTSLARLGAAAAGALGELVSDVDLRDRTLEAVAAAGREADAALLAMMRADAWRVRVDAVRVMSRIGVTSKDVAKPIGQLARNDPHEMVRDVAFDVVQALVEARDAELSDYAGYWVHSVARFEAQLNAIRELRAALRDRPEEADAALLVAVRHRGSDVRSYAVRAAFTASGPLEVFTIGLGDHQPRVRRDAARALFARGEMATLATTGDDRLNDVPAVALASVEQDTPLPGAAAVLARYVVTSCGAEWRERICATDARIEGRFERQRDLRAGGKRGRHLPELPPIEQPVTLTAALGGLRALGLAGGEALGALISADANDTTVLAVFAMAQLGTPAVEMNAGRVVPLLDSDAPGVAYVAAIALAPTGRARSSVVDALARGVVSTDDRRSADGFMRYSRDVVPDMFRHATRPALRAVLADLTPDDCRDQRIRRALVLLVDIREPEDATVPLVARAKALLEDASGSDSNR